MTDGDAGIDCVFEEVAMECYARVERLTELRDYEGADVAERAVEFVLFGERAQKEKELLLADVLRNARFSVRRSTARRNAMINEVGRLARSNVSAGASGGFVQSATPEDLVIANELLQHLQEEASRCGVHGRQVLSGLICGNTVYETAARAGVSTATVDRTIRRLRVVAEEAGYRRAA